MTTTQIPQHVAAQLSHLTSRPGIQSTLILSRKDGSIIQATGKIAAASNDSANASTPTAASQPLQHSSSLEDSQPLPANNENSADPPTTNEPAPYKPTQAEILASHIHNFVASASALSTSLSRSPDAENSEPEYETRNGLGGGTEESKPGNENENGIPERDDEDEVKLLRLRTKIHEIIIIPDRRFLLCVVHDVSSGTGGSNTR